MSNLNKGTLVPSVTVDGCPIGTVIAYAGNAAPPTGYLWLRKAKLKKTKYATLYGVLGDLFNDGSQASDEFMLPDADGYFIRNFDSTGVIDVGRVFGSKKTDQIANHQHLDVTLVDSVAGSSGVSGITNLTSTGSIWGKTYGQSTGANNGRSYTSPANGFQGTGTAGLITGGVVGGLNNTETSPKNIALNYVIKAENLYTPQQLMVAGQQFVLNAATESTDGTVKIATQSEVNAGADDFKAVTSRKLRFGFQALFAATGYLTLPSWLGGFVFQWGTISITSGTLTRSWPIQFPNAAFGVWATPILASPQNAIIGVATPTITGCTFYSTLAAAGSAPVASTVSAFFLTVGN